MTPLRLALLQVAGAACLLLALWLPRYCFPLVWIFAVAAVAPINYRRGLDGPAPNSSKPGSTHLPCGCCWPA